MKSSNTSRRAGLSFARLAVATALAFGVPGSLAAASAAEAGKSNEQLREMLPANVRDAGTMKVVISLAYPPMEYSDAGSTDLKGADIDLAKEVADRLGLKIDFQNVEFSQLITSVTTGRADMIWTAFSDIAKRQGQLDFIDYFRTGNQIFVPVAYQDSIKTVQDLCGKTVSVATGTSWVGFMEGLSKETCDASSPMNLLQIGTLGEQLMQLKQDRAQAVMMGFEGVLDLQKQQPDKFYTIGELYDPGNYGIAFAKESTQLRDAVKATLEAMKADGTYEEILDRYGLKQAAMEDFTINAGK
ncbi:amino acid ABC transporter substrate-binding protein (PAAT family) [Pseudaminobacter salicylatoxidans]|uniref:Amino acid ABC transporter substrate-binding protein (PAAT family) n=1 Tax=Pseudaminobacter salicylatoxidans TaxID=93369 RepID=A0A316C990_PSESE|nr:ABC transporter substrate-binding protein [Pseudaminobacter salicylatoxidans]PWJ86240.1 amino acid ABC transporter substrate-binding protein (PAAT family) [Pseudaminobacter salicylatoxidans]